MAIAAEALIACNRETAKSSCGATTGREAMMAMIERDQRHCSIRRHSCSRGARLGSKKGIASGSAKALHLDPRGPEVSRSRTCGGSNFSCCLALLYAGEVQTLLAKLLRKLWDFSSVRCVVAVSKTALSSGSGRPPSSWPATKGGSGAGVGFGSWLAQSPVHQLAEA